MSTRARVLYGLAVAVIAACYVPDQWSYHAPSTPTQDAGGEECGVGCTCAGELPIDGGCPSNLCLVYPLDQPCGCNLRCCVDPYEAFVYYNGCIPTDSGSRDASEDADAPTDAIGDARDAATDTIGD